MENCRLAGAVTKGRFVEQSGLLSYESIAVIYTNVLFLGIALALRNRHNVLEEVRLTQPPTDRVERAVRHSIGSIMSGRASIERVIERLADQGFRPIEIEAILQEASRRMSVVGKAADRDFYQNCIKLGVLSLLLAFGMIAIVGYPQHGRGESILYSALFFGLGALVYGAIGKIFRR